MPQDRFAQQPLAERRGTAKSGLPGRTNYIYDVRVRCAWMLIRGSFHCFCSFLLFQEDTRGEAVCSLLPVEASVVQCGLTEPVDKFLAHSLVWSNRRHKVSPTGSDLVAIQRGDLSARYMDQADRTRCFIVLTVLRSAHILAACQA